MAIDFQDAMNEVERFAGLDRYPRGQGAQRAVGELVAVAKLAYSLQVMKLVADDWLATQRNAPKPADLRSAIFEVNRRFEPKQAKCPMCSGNGFITEWRMVTFKGNSYHVDRSERLDIATSKQATELSESLPTEPREGRQEVVSCAVMCSCHPLYGKETA